MKENSKKKIIRERVPIKNEERQNNGREWGEINLWERIERDTKSCVLKTHCFLIIIPNTPYTSN